MPIVQDGKHLGAAREWIKVTFRDGDRLKWGSDQALSVTVAQLEELAQVVANVLQGDEEKAIGYLKDLRKVLNDHHYDTSSCNLGDLPSYVGTTLSQHEEDEEYMDGVNSGGSLLVMKYREALGLIARNGMEWTRSWIVDRAENALREEKPACTHGTPTENCTICDFAASGDKS